MKSKPLIIVGAIGMIAAVAAVFVVALNLASQQGARPTVGSAAPDFNIGLYDGYRAGLPSQTKLSDLRGKVVVMNFWASWCVECKKEADALQAVHDKFKARGLVMLGVNYLDNDTPAIAYLKTFSVSYANGIDLQQHIAKTYRITGVPETFIIDKKGNVRNVIIQPTGEAELSATVQKLLDE